VVDLKISMVLTNVKTVLDSKDEN